MNKREKGIKEETSTSLEGKLDTLIKTMENVIFPISHELIGIFIFVFLLCLKNKREKEVHISP